MKYHLCVQLTALYIVVFQAPPLQYTSSAPLALHVRLSSKTRGSSLNPFLLCLPGEKWIVPLLTASYETCGWLFLELLEICFCHVCFTTKRCSVQYSVGIFDENVARALYTHDLSGFREKPPFFHFLSSLLCSYKCCTSSCFIHEKYAVWLHCFLLLCFLTFFFLCFYALSHVRICLWSILK